ncbi:hypothetical protein OMP38_06505 [Cohnella ginsengisoli]|uniref:Right-handed parallel beta-helix repeat-containing protein n=1 Tax=Cohnella ginsengisoli TaxID=425004 RepID=A0A9X4KEG0_9BACL|nr:hypothetical protein [Cohnella ginsengisoli]MDG0790538.1 hypothetical protein [Cohnella ginsengisoli]
MNHKRLRPALMTAFSLLLILQLVGFVFSPAVVHAADAAVYYVSQSEGDDAADGLSETTAWKTLTHVSAQTFQPGDRILLKSGDRWTGETLTLRGSGTPELPIELSSYGTGDKPLISPQMTDASAITLHNEEGWRIDGIAMEKAMTGINAEFDGVYDKRSLAFENLDIRDMDDTFNSKPNLYNHFSTGIALKGNGNASTYHLRGLTMKSIVFDNVNTPLFQGGDLPIYEHGGVRHERQVQGRDDRRSDRDERQAVGLQLPVHGGCDHHEYQRGKRGYAGRHARRRQPLRHRRHRRRQFQKRRV